MDFLKAEQVSTSKWRVLAIPYGGPFKGKDLDGEYFSAKTDIKPDWFDRRPLVWHHNLDANLKADPVIGTADDLEQGDDGWWATVWLDRSHRYWEQVNGLLSAGKIYGSSGSLPNFVRTDAQDGRDPRLAVHRADPHPDPCQPLLAGRGGEGRRPLRRGPHRPHARRARAPYLRPRHPVG
jgi:hypothetical protein